MICRLLLSMKSVIQVLSISTLKAEDAKMHSTKNIGNIVILVKGRRKDENLNYVNIYSLMIFELASL